MYLRITAMQKFGSEVFLGDFFIGALFTYDQVKQKLPTLFKRCCAGSRISRKLQDVSVDTIEPLFPVKLDNGNTS